MKSIVLGHIKLEYWWKLLEYQYQHNSIGTRSTLALPWSQEGVNLVLQMLDLLCKLKNDVTGLKEQLASALQDQRLVPFLARAMSSDSRDSVQRALRILCDANSLPDFQAIWLGDLIASNNAAREEEMTLLRRPIETNLSPPSSPRHQVSINNSRNSTSLRSAGLDHAPVQISAPVKNANCDANIESLIEKMKSGLEVSLLVFSFFSLTLLWHNIDSCTELPHDKTGSSRF